jgi:hypothetical protein
MGGVILGLAFLLRDAPMLKDSGNADVKKISDAAFYIMIIFGGLGILAGIMAALTAYCNKTVCTGCVHFIHNHLVWILGFYHLNRLCSSGHPLDPRWL